MIGSDVVAGVLAFMLVEALTLILVAGALTFENHKLRRRLMRLEQVLNA